MANASRMARHRAPGRAVTPVTLLARQASQSLGTAGRKSATIVATTGLLATMVATPASASSDDSSGSGTADVSALTASLRDQLRENPTASLTVDEAYSFDLEAAVLDVTPAPRPQPRPATTRTTTAVAVSNQKSVSQVAPQTPAAEGRAGELIAIAKQYQGVPYRSGGSTPSGFDCSGFTKYVYAQIGVTLPRSSAAQRNAGTRVSRADAKPGDLIWSPGHVGIYLGGNLQIDAPRPGKSIQVRSIWQSNPQFIRVIS